MTSISITQTQIRVKKFINKIMNSQEGLDLMCHIHNEKVVSVKISQNGDPQMYCQKCLTPDQISIEQLSQQLTELRSKKIQKLIELETQSEKRFISLKKVFQSIKDMFNQQINDIIMNVDNLMNETKQALQEQTEILKQPINQLSITQVDKHLKELKEEVIINHQQQYDQIKIKMIKQYLQLIKSLNKQIKGELVQPQQQDNQIIQIDNKKQENEQNQQLIGQYQLINEQKVNSCEAITMDKDEKIIVTGQSKDIKIWEMDNNRQITLKQTLSGHEKLVTTICFSGKGYWFISTGQDKQIRIWQYLEQGEWKCQQIIQNEERANQILITNDDQQFISCHLDHKIRIWMKKDQWECFQTLNGHDNSVEFISLSFNQEYLISSQYGKQMILWSKGSDRKWNQKHLLDDDCHRISFISNNELIAISQNIGKLMRFQINDQGFQLKQTLEFDKYKDENSNNFPMIFNQQQNLIIFRHFAFTYIMKKYENGDFQIYQKIYGNHTAGYMLQNSQTLIMAENSNLIQIYALQKYSEKNNIQSKQNISEKSNLIYQHKVVGCSAIVMDTNEKIMVTCQHKNILIWDMDINGSISLQHTLVGHEESVRCICFSRNKQWFISAGNDEQMRIWKYLEQGKWKCQQIIKCEEEANQILITNDDKQFISCHQDDKIRIWMKKWMKKDQWKCFQTLNGHDNSVYFISLSFNQEYLISSQYGKQMILWSKGSDLKWNQKHKLQGDNHRISFISNNELIAISKEIGKLMRYQINDQGLQLKQTLEFDKYKDENSNDFPMIFNQQQNLLIFRHFAFTYIMKKQENGDFQIYQKIYGNHTAGYMFKNGIQLILCDEEKLIEVWEIK